MRVLAASVLAIGCLVAGLSNPVPEARAAATDGPAALSGAHQEASCRDVLFLGARGSGQQPPRSLGDQVDGAYRHLGESLPTGWTIEKVALDYPARAVESMFKVKVVRTGAVVVLDPRGVRAYLAGISTGVSAATSVIADRLRRCPDQRIVLAGYSQGAMVMHRLLNQVSPSIRDRIAGAILIADGDRVPDSMSIDSGGVACRVQWRL